MSTPKDADLEAARAFLGVARNVWLKDPDGTWLQDLVAFRREAREQGRREGWELAALYVGHHHDDAELAEDLRLAATKPLYNRALKEAKD